jgi:hypothetical protein
MYTVTNFKTKKAVKDAIKGGHRVTVYSPAGMDSHVLDGVVTIEGPHYPQPHKWYARATLSDGFVVSIK